MKRIFAVLLLCLAAFIPASFAERLIPAGSILQCITSGPKISSKTVDIGDPILCRVTHVDVYGRSFPYGSYLVGRFEAYQDPGHLVGKGWMELRFDRLVLQPDTSIPINARVVEVPKYPVDKEGRIHGTGHPVRDVVEWSLPVLWPIDLINLPRRGPRPVLKAETRLTLKLLDDLGIPSQDDTGQQPALVSRQPAPIERAPAQQQFYPQQQPSQQQYQQQPIQQQYQQPVPQQMPAQQQYQPPVQQQMPVQQVYLAAPQPVIIAYAQPQPIIVTVPVMYTPPPPPVMYIYPYGVPAYQHTYYRPY